VLKFRLRLTSDGRLDLEMRGLVIPATGTASPVTTITASLYCGADGDSAPRCRLVASA
jgi:hypothetical protein